MLDVRFAVTALVCTKTSIVLGGGGGEIQCLPWTALVPASAELKQGFSVSQPAARRAWPVYAQAHGAALHAVEPDDLFTFLRDWRPASLPAPATPPVDTAGAGVLVDAALSGSTSAGATSGAVQATTAPPDPCAPSRSVEIVALHGSTAALGRKCSSPSCLAREGVDGGTFRRCGGCKRAFYCSRHCQQVHWKAGHREECKQLWQQHSRQVGG